VQLQVYESMPHVFLLFEGHPCSRTAFNEIAKFIRMATSQKRMDTQFQFVQGNGIIQETPLKLDVFPTTYSKSEVVPIFVPSDISSPISCYPRHLSIK